MTILFVITTVVFAVLWLNSREENKELQSEINFIQNDALDFDECEGCDFCVSRCPECDSEFACGCGEEDEPEHKSGAW